MKYYTGIDSDANNNYAEVIDKRNNTGSMGRLRNHYGGLASLESGLLETMPGERIPGHCVCYFFAVNAMLL
jgi:hypothetical protein